MTDKPRIIQYETTDKGYMRFKNLNEYPRLSDIKYLILMTLKHFYYKKNYARYEEFKYFLKSVRRAAEIEEFRHDYVTLRHFMEEKE